MLGGIACDMSRMVRLAGGACAELEPDYRADVTRSLTERFVLDECLLSICPDSRPQLQRGSGIGQWRNNLVLDPGRQTFAHGAG